MRFALSAAAAASGLVLFAAAFLGEPEVYLRHARQQWNAWIDPEPSRPLPDQEDGQKAAALAARIQALQDEVSHLKDQLDAKQANADVPQGVPSATSSVGKTFQAAPALVIRPDPSVTSPVTVPERRLVAAPAERREAAAKPAAVTAPAKPPPARPEPDDTRSVLARLRQVPPAPAPVTDPVEDRPKVATSPALLRAIGARAAFTSGHVEDARRLLQEAQLLLVFRRPDLSSDEASAAARGSVDIAHALEALGANDIGQGGLFLERAVDELTGARTDAPERVAAGKKTGYAPAYPSQ